MQDIKYLLDTNVCVFFLRGKHNIAEQIRKVGISNCYLSEITVAELLYGAECRLDPINNVTLIHKFCNNFKILPIGNVLDKYAKEKSNLRKAGQLIDDFDLLIGCTSLKYNMVLVTDNTKHFSRIGTNLENWIER